MDAFNPGCGVRRSYVLGLVVIIMFHNVEEEKKMGLFFLDLTYLHNVYICSIYAVKQLKKNKIVPEEA